MRTIVFCLATAPLALAACSAPAGDATSPSALQSLANESPADGRVNAYLASLYDHASIRHSYTAESGDRVDCTDFVAEPSVKTLLAEGHTVAEILRPFEPRQPDPLAPGVDDEGEARLCPPLTVPHGRVTAESIAAAGGLDAYQRAIHPLAPTEPATKATAVTPDTNPGSGGAWPAGDNPNYGHVISYQTGTTIQGGEATLSIGPKSVITNAFVDHSSNHSLAQIWIIGGTGTGLQTLEVGAKIDASIGGPYLFVGGTPDAYKDFCENGQPAFGTTTCLPWVPNPSATLYPGSSLPASVTGGAQHELKVSVVHDCYITVLNPLTVSCEYAVNVGVDGASPTTIGYFPVKGYGTGALASGSGTIFEVGGEIFDGSTNFSEVTMGEGTLFDGFGDYGFSAYVHDFGYYATSCLLAGCTPALVQSGATLYTTRSLYAYDDVSPAGSSSWSNWFYYGDYLFVRLFPITSRDARSPAAQTH